MDGHAEAFDADGLHRPEPRDASDQTASGDVLSLPMFPGQTLITLPSETEYRCPGESHPISRAVHLSRLAAFFPACRQCQHRHDTGLLAPRIVDRIQRVERRVVCRSVFQPNGVRGVFLNDLTAPLAARIARTYASLLWDAVPLTGRMDQAVSPPTRRGPTLVVGYDERPSSPLILSAVIDALRIMGCPVVDIGLVSRPCFAFAVDHLQAAGGMFVTGSGCDASWSGIDLVGEGACPLSQQGRLDAVEHGLDRAMTRPTRRAAHQRSFQALVPYEAGLLKHFHALRPLTIVCAVRPRPTRRTLRKLFAQLPCTLSEVEATGASNSPTRHDILMTRIRQQVVQKDAHLGILVDDDGARCSFVDEQGIELDPVLVSGFLARLVRSEFPNASIAIESSALADLATALPNVELTDGGATLETMSMQMSGTRALFGGGASGRYWFRESYPACDAILTIARMLQALSRSDAPVSAAVGRPSPL